MGLELSYDEATVGLLLAGDDEGVSSLAHEAGARMEGALECPECGDEGPHDDNGEVGYALSYCCASCGCCFDAS